MSSFWSLKHNSSIGLFLFAFLDLLVFLILNSDREYLPQQVAFQGVEHHGGKVFQVIPSTSRLSVAKLNVQLLGEYGADEVLVPLLLNVLAGLGFLNLLASLKLIMCTSQSILYQPRSCYRGFRPRLRESACTSSRSRCVDVSIIAFTTVQGYRRHSNKLQSLFEALDDYLIFGSISEDLRNCSCWSSQIAATTSIISDIACKTSNISKNRRVFEVF